MSPPPLPDRLAAVEQHLGEALHWLHTAQHTRHPASVASLLRELRAALAALEGEQPVDEPAPPG